MEMPTEVFHHIIKYICSQSRIGREGQPHSLVTTKSCDQSCDSILPLLQWNGYTASDGYHKNKCFASELVATDVAQEGDWVFNTDRTKRMRRNWERAILFNRAHLLAKFPEIFAIQYIFRYIRNWHINISRAVQVLFNLSVIKKNHSH